MSPRVERKMADKISVGPLENENGEIIMGNEQTVGELNQFFAYFFWRIRLISQ